jgi:hypothetical protein
MKKRLLPTIIILALVAMLAAQPIAAASPADQHELAARAFISKIAARLPEFAHWSASSVYERQALHDPASLAVSAYLYELNCGNSACGYLIVDADSENVVEFSSGVSPFRQYLNAYRAQKFANRRIDAEELLYKPGTYAIRVRLDGKPDWETYAFTEDDGLRVQVAGISRMALNDTLSETAAGNLAVQKTGGLGLDSERSDAESARTPASAPPLVHYKLISGVPDTDYYISCIPTAIGNVIGYWDSHGYPNLIIFPVQIWTCIHDISDWMIAFYGSNTTNAAIPGATQTYCRAQYPQNFTVTNIWNPAFSTYTSQIANNRPTLLGFAAGGPYGPDEGHMTTGVGYYYEDGEPYKYTIVHDAWEPNDDHYVAWGSYNDFMAKIIP